MKSNRALLAPVVLLLTLGCTTPPPPPPLAAPPLLLRTRHVAGSALAGALPGVDVASVDVDPGRALAVRCRLRWLARVAPDVLAPLAPRTRHVLETRRGDPVRAAPELVANVRAGMGEAAAAFATGVWSEDLQHAAAMPDLEAALPARVTVAFAITAPGWVSLEPGAPRRIVLHVSRKNAGADGIDVTLELSGLVTPPPPEEDPVEPEEGEEAPPPVVLPPVPHREVLVLEEPPAVDGAPLVLLFPLRMGEHAGSLVCVVDARTAPTREPELGAHVAATRRCRSEILAATQGAAARASGLTEDAARRRELTTALRGLGDGRRRRAALVRLASTVDAPVAGDVALVADDVTLARWVAALRAAQTPETATEPAALAWLLERHALELLLGGAGDESSPPLPPALEGVLLRHAGEAARSPAALKEALATCGDLAGLKARLVEENLIFLEDSNPGARVRALDWLAARRLAPPDFDPLAPVKERRRVLARAQEAREAEEKK